MSNWRPYATIKLTGRCRNLKIFLFHRFFDKKIFSSSFRKNFSSPISVNSIIDLFLSDHRMSSWRPDAIWRLSGSCRNLKIFLFYRLFDKVHFCTFWYTVPKMKVYKNILLQFSIGNAACKDIYKHAHILILFRMTLHLVEGTI